MRCALHSGHTGNGYLNTIAGCLFCDITNIYIEMKVVPFMVSINSVKRYRKQFKNWFSVIFLLLYNKYPILIKKRNGNSIVAFNPGFVHLASTGLNFQYIKDEDKLSFTYKNNNLTFFGSYYNNDFADTYGFEIYGRLRVKNNVVIDIGANIGDTSIYFALNGAKRVIAIEPSPYAFKNLIRNINSNSVNNVLPINAGISSEIGVIKLKDEIRDVTGVKALNQAEGLEIPVFTITTLLNRYKLYGENLVLKMDCEGCEFDSLINENSNTINMFSEIFMEYHNKPYPLISKLSNLKFRVYVNNFEITDLKKISNKILNSRLGYIYAVR